MKATEILMDNDYEPMFFDGEKIHAFWDEDYGVPMGYNWGTSTWTVDEFKKEFEVDDFENDLPTESEYEEEQRIINEGECDGYIDCSEPY